MVDPHELTFAQALGVEPLGEDRFEGIYADWAGSPRVFGGNVLGKAIMAASATVESPKVFHSIHGYFLRPATPGDRPILQVERVRDGRSYSNREVRVLIEGKETARFLLSFCVPEAGRDYQPLMPKVEAPELEQAEVGFHPFELIELGSAGPDEDGFYEWTRRAWFRCASRAATEPSLKYAALAYISDHSGMALRPGDEDYEENAGDASLDHSLYIHREPDLTKWHLFDLRCLSVSSRRSAIQGRIFAESGELVATMNQELLIRPLGGPPPELDRTGLWKPEA